MKRKGPGKRKNERRMEGWKAILESRRIAGSV